MLATMEANRSTPRGDAPDDEKAKELILYLAWKEQEDPRFGETKLHKLLFFSDFYFYGLHGRTITGQCYQRQKFGPTLRRYLRLKAELEEEKAAVTQPASFFGRNQKRLVPLRRPDLSKFTAEEIALIDEAVTELWEHTGTDLSDYTHKMPAWLAFPMGADIPPSTVFITKRPLTDDESQWLATVRPSSAV